MPTRLSGRRRDWSRSRWRCRCSRPVSIAALADDYKDRTHFHVWTDAISGAGALVFTGVSWLLLAARRAVLRHRHRPGREPHRRGLVRLELFGRGLRRGAGCAAQPAEDHRHAAIGGDAGLLDHRGAARGGAGSFSCAVVLASGISVLWNATESATPLLLSVAIGAFRAGQCGAPQRRSRGVRQSRTAVGGAGAGAGDPAAAARRDLDRHADRRIRTQPRTAVGYRRGRRGGGLWPRLFIAPIRGRMAGWMERVRSANMHLAVATACWPSFSRCHCSISARSPRATSSRGWKSGCGFRRRIRFRRAALGFRRRGPRGAGAAGRGQRSRHRGPCERSARGGSADLSQCREKRRARQPACQSAPAIRRRGPAGTEEYNMSVPVRGVPQCTLRRWIWEWARTGSTWWRWSKGQVAQEEFDISGPADEDAAERAGGGRHHQ